MGKGEFSTIITAVCRKCDKPFLTTPIIASTEENLHTLIDAALESVTTCACGCFTF